MPVMPPRPATMPGFSDGWGGSFADTQVVDNFWYDSIQQLLYVGLVDGQFNVFVNVPASVGQAFSYTLDTDGFYANNVYNAYSPCLLTEDCRPLVCENGTVLVVR